MATQHRSPRSELTTLRSLFDRFFDESAWADSAEGRLPLDIVATEDMVTIEAALPGIAREDVELTIHQDTLTISIKDEKQRSGGDGERIYREVRRSHGSRTITLPSGLDLDRAEASFEDGMLRISLPRAEESKPRQIRIGAEEAQRGSREEGTPGNPAGPSSGGPSEEVRSS